MHKIGAIPYYGGIVPDTKEAVRRAIKQAISTSDLILLSGGVSVGDYDFVPEALAGFEFRPLFNSVAMQPGRPTLFGQCGKTFCCGLPGNPVSTYVVFEILVKPFLYRLMGHTYKPRLIQVKLLKEVMRRNKSRQLTLPVRFAGPDAVEPLEYHGAAHINSLTKADAFLTISKNIDGFRAGDNVLVRLV